MSHHCQWRTGTLSVFQNPLIRPKRKSVNAFVEDADLHTYICMHLKIQPDSAYVTSAPMSIVILQISRTLSLERHPSKMRCCLDNQTYP
jgi:hypothetical protein